MMVRCTPWTATSSRSCWQAATPSAQAFKEAGPKILEPIYDLEVLVPADYMGDVMSDLQGRRAIIMGMDSEAGYQKLSAKIPLKELANYSISLSSLTGGRASFTTKFSSYELVPNDVQQQLIKEHEAELAGRTIWIIAIVMGFSFLALLYLQVSYIEQMAKMKKEQFDESVNRSLYQASRNLELNETLRYLEKDVNETERRAFRQDSIMARSGMLNDVIQHTHQYAVAGKDGTVYSSFELKTITTKPSTIPKAMILRSDKSSIDEASKSLQEIVRNRYVYQKALLDEVVYNILYTASEKPLKERINFKMLDQDIKSELMNNGINIPYHFTVSTADGREVYRCPDYSEEGEEYTYTQVLFRNDPQAKMGVLKVHFPDMNSYILSSVRFMIPAIVFTVVLLITFIFTIVVIFRQKRYTEIKNDFINNMTHELKTPISSISLAAQMLNDDSVSKSPQMQKHLGGVINDESKRLRFLVEKVLQMSMFDRKSVSFKKKELDLNELLEQIASTFSLRVEHTGGKIYTEIEAVDSAIYVDEVHFQNAITNLMDNAVKYRKPDEPLDIYIRTWNEKDRLCFSIRDTGLGIKKENVKKIFDKFYRVHTGNVHDVKGFGLGLAYVKKIIDLHEGEIKCESELGKGTKFTITLPILQEEVKNRIKTFETKNNQKLK